MDLNNAFGSIPFIEELSEESSLMLQQHSRKHHFHEKKILIHKGQKIGGVYFVTSGSLRVYAMNEKGQEKTIYTLRSGESCVFTLNCVFKHVVYPAWVTLDSPNASVLEIPSNTFKQLYSTEDCVKDYLLDALSQRVFDLMQAVEEVSIHDLGYRINSFLLRNCPDDYVLNMSHQDIATSLGTAREVVSRHLSDLEKAGHLRLARMKIEIIDPQKLATLSE